MLNPDTVTKTRPILALLLLLFAAAGCSYGGSGGDGGSEDGDGQCRGDPPGAWEAYDFSYHPAPTSCTAERYVRLMPGYELWVGAILCDSEQYKLFLAEEKTGTFYQIGDFAGHGQDHCELVNADFTIPNEDDITSGGCTTCEVGGIVSSNTSLGPGWSRPHFGDCFTFHPEWPEHNLHSTQWYRCGVSIP